MTGAHLHLVGIGTGNPEHLTLEAVRVLNDVDLILIPHKGEEKAGLADLRHQICSQVLSNSEDKIIGFEMPVRDPAIQDYEERVDRWHDAIAECWQAAFASRPRPPKTVGLLVWGDPSLYDSTLRIADRLLAAGVLSTVSVVPGITSVQALCAAHAIPVNEINGPFTITTGRQLRDHGWPAATETLIVMLDGECSFQTLDPTDFEIWWGAHLGMPGEVVVSGLLGEVTDQIITARAEARAREGWVMDTYLLRKKTRA